MKKSFRQSSKLRPLTLSHGTEVLHIHAKGSAGSPSTAAITLNKREDICFPLQKWEKCYYRLRHRRWGQGTTMMIFTLLVFLSFFFAQRRYVSSHSSFCLFSSLLYLELLWLLFRVRYPRLQSLKHFSLYLWIVTQPW